METYLILKDNAGPWEQVRHLFPLVPIKSIHPSVVGSRGRQVVVYEIAGDKLSEPQVQALAHAFLWQNEDKPTMSFERACSYVRSRFLIAKHWVSHVYSESPAGIIVKSEDCLEQVYIMSTDLDSIKQQTK